MASSAEASEATYFILLQGDSEMKKSAILIEKDFMTAKLRCANAKKWPLSLPSFNVFSMSKIAH